MALMVSGALVVVWPYIDAALVSQRMVRAVDDFERDVEALSARPGGLEGLRSAVDAYNAGLYESGQAGLKDAWSYTVASFDLASWGLGNEVYGCLRIPDAAIDMPVYLGASAEHLDLGAAHLTQTSLPIRAVGGVSTAAVIAGHRGYRANEYFNNIVELERGDVIYFDNPWETLEYRVVETHVIAPEDVDEIKIREGHNLLELITCHPLYQNYQRYVVIAELCAPSLDSAAAPR